MTLQLIAPTPQGRAMPWVALFAAATLSLAGCGGDDNIQAVVPPAPAPAPTGAASQAVPSTATIVAAQAGVDGTVSTVALPASGVPSAGVITAQQAALDGGTSAGTTNINADQAAMDANGVQPTKSF